MSYSDDEFEDYDDDFEDDAPSSPVRKAESKPASEFPGSAKRQSKGQSRQLAQREHESGKGDISANQVSGNEAIEMEGLAKHS